MIPDIINGLFEAVGGIFVWMNCKRLYRDKEVRGVYVPATAVFTTWGFWNLFYYPHLGQMWSLAGGLVIFTGNCVWLALAVYYSNRNRPMPDGWMVG